MNFIRDMIHELRIRMAHRRYLTEQTPAAWDALRLLVIARSPAQVARMESRMNLQ